MKSGRDEAARGSIPGSSPRPDREHRKLQPTTCYTVVCVKTAVEISEESQNGPGLIDKKPSPCADQSAQRRPDPKERPKLGGHVGIDRGWSQVALINKLVKRDPGGQSQQSEHAQKQAAARGSDQNPETEKRDQKPRGRPV